MVSFNFDTTIFLPMKNIEDSAKDILHRSIRPEGILASAHTIDNYHRVWSRDAMMTGLIGLMAGDETIVSGLKHSILTLAKFQHHSGVIPSNVGVDQGQSSVSYGTLVGRTDATIWWVIGTITLLESDADFRTQNKDILEPRLIKALHTLEVWEFNNRGLIYSPLGGNWADEFVTSGYTLYDNVLYLWSLQLASTYFDTSKIRDKALSLRGILKVNYDNTYILNQGEAYYHPTAVERRKTHVKPFFSSALTPAGFDQRWDLAGNALALVMGLYDDPMPLVDFIGALKHQYETNLIPVFAPIIEPHDADWRLLESNFGYHFKNYPYQFHNGGFWPIFGGWLCYGLRMYRFYNLADNLQVAYETALSKSDFKFYEFHDIRTGEGKGVEGLCFSASGYLLMTLMPKNFKV